MSLVEKSPEIQKLYLAANGDLICITHEQLGYYAYRISEYVSAARPKQTGVNGFWAYPNLDEITAEVSEHNPGCQEIQDLNQVPLYRVVLKDGSASVALKPWLEKWSGEIVSATEIHAADVGAQDRLAFDASAFFTLLRGTDTVDVQQHLLRS